MALCADEHWFGALHINIEVATAVRRMPPIRSIIYFSKDLP